MHVVLKGGMYSKFLFFCFGNELRPQLFVFPLLLTCIYICTLDRIEVPPLASKIHDPR